MHRLRHSRPLLAFGPWAFPIATISLGLPAIALRLSGADLPVLAETALFGLGILSAAFLLGAAAEAAQHDIPASLSLAVLAFVAVLPEYAVDLLFAWRAGAEHGLPPGEQIGNAQFAIANMTGGNRLLLGVGWAAVLFAFVYKNRKTGLRILVLPRTISLEIVVLAVATAYSFLIPLKGSITLIDAVILLSLFGFYLYRASQHPMVAPPVGGPADMVAELPKWRRRAVVTLFFAYAAGVIVASAEPFADGLIETGSKFGIDEFLLVQWVAPIASESPEFLAALYLVWRGAAAFGMTALISSKVNQWTLLIASLPIAFAISSGTLDGLPMDGRQREEVFLTAAQSLFGVMLILDRRLSAKAAFVLLGLFLGQFLLTDSTIRWGFAITYLVLAGGLLLRQYRLIPRVVRDGLTNSSHAPDPDLTP